MPAQRPWYPAFPADYFAATQGWDLDMKGPYRLLIDLLNERDRPFPDDPKFVAGVLGCSVQRWRKVREFLIGNGKLIPTPDGQHLTNPRFEREHAKRTADRAERVEDGRLGGLISAAKKAGQTELFDEDRPVGAGARTRTENRVNPEKVLKNFRKTSGNVASHSEIVKTISNEINGNAQPPPQAPCARDSSETIKTLNTSQPNGSAPCAPARGTEPLANASLGRLYEAVCEAAGVCFTDPTAIDRAMTHVEKWRNDGLDFDEVVVPTIRQIVLTTDNPTRTLGRFNRDVRHQQAKRAASVRRGEPYAPPAVPKLNPEGEDPEFLSLRTDLLEQTSPAWYCLFLNSVTFEDLGDQGHGRRPLKIHGLDYLVNDLRHGRFGALILNAAKPYGYTALW